MPSVGDISARRRRAILTVAIGAIALETALLGVVAPLLPEIEERTGTGDAALGLAIAAYSIPILFISIPVGRLADRIGRRPLLLAGMVMTAFGSILIASSEALLPLLAGRAVQGIGSAMSWVAALALVSDLALPGRKGEAIGFAMAANSLGAIGGPALGGVIGGEISFAAPFIFVAVAAGGLFTAGLFVLPRHAAVVPQEGAGTRSLRDFAPPGILLPGLAAVVGAGSLGLLDFTVPLDLDRRLAIEATAIGILFGCVAAVDAVTSPIAGRISDRVGRPRVAICGAVLLAIAGCLLAVLPGFGGVIAAMGVYGVGVATLFASTVPWLDDVFGSADRGLAYGSLNIVYSIGYTIGPLAAGWLLEGPGADASYLLITVVAIGLVGLLLVRLRAGPGAPGPVEGQMATTGSALGEEVPK